MKIRTSTYISVSLGSQGLEKRIFPCRMSVFFCFPENLHDFASPNILGLVGKLRAITKSVVESENTYICVHLREFGSHRLQKSNFSRSDA